VSGSRGERKKDYIVIGGRGCYIEGNAAQMLCSACFA
jgi:hypothetical protein